MADTPKTEAPKTDPKVEPKTSTAPAPVAPSSKNSPVEKIGTLTITNR